MSATPEIAHRVIAIDGPAASGKSSVARALAQKLGFAYVNSGAMYRAATWFVLQQNVASDDRARIGELIDRAEIHCELVDAESRIFINGNNPESFLRTDRVNEAVSPVSSVPRVRERLVEQMRSYAQEHDLVVEGRDIGSVVFPITPFKFYIDASPAVRLERRMAQGQRDEIAARDRADSSRPVSPLVISADAHVVDSSALSVDGVVDEIVRRLQEQGLTVGLPT